MDSKIGFPDSVTVGTENDALARFFYKFGTSLTMRKAGFFFGCI
jgi:hypothetical protein